MSAGSDHAQFRELISGRLDDSLTLAEAARLIEHLARCGRCRATERAYRAQRQQLRSPHQRPVLPPRDLWARTSAALDREVARTGGRLSPRHQLGHLLAGGAAVASVAAIGLSLGLITNQLPRAQTPPTSPGAAEQVVRPTPFTVPAEALAFLGSGAEGLTVYRTRVDRVCPAAAIDCVDYQASAPAIVRLPRMIQPSNLALSPNGGRLAIEGRELGGQDIVAVVVMPDDELARQPGRSGPGGGATPRVDPSPTTQPTFSPMTDGPSASATASATAAPTASVTPAPLTTPSASMPPAASPSPDGAEISASPDAATPSPVASELPEEQMLAILDEVRSVGASAAWSADGSALAFSAMPADLSRGPDVYIWRPGDGRAQPLTSDHGSYFASWAGTRVVVSRVGGAEVDGTDAAEPVVATVVIDPLTGEERTTDAGAGLWLPAVNSQGTRLVAWHGSLGWGGHEIEPLSGALYVADWPAVDPFAGPATQHVPGPDSSAVPVDGEDGRATEEAVPGEEPAAVDEPGEGDNPASEEQPADEDRATEERPTEPARILQLVPVEKDRDPTNDPVHDWQTRWSPDGDVLAVWIADVPGASWGQLTVTALNHSTGALDDADPLLGPSLARRAFTLGSNRVAWVAPADGEPQGELRIRTWGPDGFGDLRLRHQPLNEVVPAS